MAKPQPEELWYAANQGNVERLKKLIGDGGDIEELGSLNSTPIETAAFVGHAAADQVLLDAGAEASISVLAALGKTEKLVEILEREPDLLHKHPDQVVPPIYWAACFGHTDCVVYLLSKGADPNAANIEGNEPLLRACWKGHVAVVAILALSGADTAVKDPRSGMSLQEIAARKKNQELSAVIEWVSKRGTSPDEPMG